jgi:hypothetical protein
MPNRDKPLIIPAAEIGHDIPLPRDMVGWRIDKDAMLLYPKRSDGSEGEPLDLVPLFERIRTAER